MRAKLHMHKNRAVLVKTTEGLVDFSVTRGDFWYEMSMTPDEARRVADALNAAASEMDDAQARRA